MKLFRQFYFLVAISMLLFYSCTTQKYLAISDGSKSNGTLTMVYEYGAFEKPVVHWEEAKQSAISKCQAWGYKSADFFDVGIQNCIGVDGYGNCIRWRVTYKCQCTDK